MMMIKQACGHSTFLMISSFSSYLGLLGSCSRTTIDWKFDSLEFVSNKLSWLMFQSNTRSFIRIYHLYTWQTDGSIFVCEAIYPVHLFANMFYQFYVRIIETFDHEFFSMIRYSLFAFILWQSLIVSYQINVSCLTVRLPSVSFTLLISHFFCWYLSFIY